VKKIIAGSSARGKKASSSSTEKKKGNLLGVEVHTGMRRPLAGARKIQRRKGPKDPLRSRYCDWATSDRGREKKNLGGGGKVRRTEIQRIGDDLDTKKPKCKRGQQKFRPRSEATPCKNNGVNTGKKKKKIHQRCAISGRTGNRCDHAPADKNDAIRGNRWLGKRASPNEQEPVMVTNARPPGWQDNRERSKRGKKCRNAIVNDYRHDRQFFSPHIAATGIRKGIVEKKAAPRDPQEKTSSRRIKTQRRTVVRFGGKGKRYADEAGSAERGGKVALITKKEQRSSPQEPDSAASRNGAGKKRPVGQPKRNDPLTTGCTPKKVVLQKQKLEVQSSAANRGGGEPRGKDFHGEEDSVRGEHRGNTFDDPPDNILKQLRG